MPESTEHSHLNVQSKPLNSNNYIKKANWEQIVDKFDIYVSLSNCSLVSTMQLTFRID